MADKSLISWTDATWPVVAGCTRVSPACDHCYAIRDSWRMGHNPNPKIRTVYEGTVEPGPIGSQVDRSLDWSGVVRPLPQRLDWPLRWKKPRRIFCCNMSDLFHEALPFSFVAAVFGIMAATPQHTHQVLTKRAVGLVDWFQVLDRRAENAREVFPDESLNWRRRHVLRAAAIYYTGRPLPSIPESPVWPLPNVHIGVTAEIQAMADDRIGALLQVPAAVRFVSVEPMLGPVNLEPYLWLSGASTAGPWRDRLGRKRGGGGIGGQAMSAIPSGDIGWVISGGETGPGARPMHPDWARSLRDQCQAARTAFFFKQWGEYSSRNHLVPVGGGDTPRALVGEGTDGEMVVYRVGKAAAGHLLDGQEHHEFPEDR